MSTFVFHIRITILLLMALNLTAQSRYEIGVKLDGPDLDQPWNGGFNAPQFSNIDLNRDGITDLISFDRQGDMLRTYIQLPASGRWVLDWEYASIFPSLVDWVYITDYNNDGVEDLFTSSSKTGVAGISVYRGSYENDQWHFTKIFDRDKEYLQVPSGNLLTNLYASWDDIPSINDIDGDGDLDVLAFEPGGSYITYFQNLSVENGWGNDSLRFIVKDVCWGKILENELSEEVYLSETPDVCSHGNYQSGEIITPRHSGSTILSMDQDYDGDQDAWLGDISSRRLVFLRNGLNTQEAWITEQDAHFPSTDSSVYLPYFVAGYAVELDDDPEPELLAAVNAKSLAEDRVSVWRYDDSVSTGPLDYHLTTKGFLQNDMIDIGSHSRPAVTDVNGDGLQDLVIGGYSFEEGSLTRLPVLWLLLNEGTLSQPYFRLVSSDYLSMSQFADIPNFDFAPAFGDLDGNGSTDLVIGDQNGKLFFFRNLALPGQTLSFDAPVYPFMNINVGVSATPQIADINGDGLADLVVGERTGNGDVNGRCSNLNYFQNIGSVGNAIFNNDATAAPNTQCFGRVLFDIVIGLPQYSTPVIVPSGNEYILMTGSDPGKLAIYDGLSKGLTGAIDLVDEAYGNLDFGNRSAPALADLNGDGRYELIVGNQRGGLELFNTEIMVGSVGVENPVVADEKPYTILSLGDGQFEITWKERLSGQWELLDMQGRMISSGGNRGEVFSHLDTGNLPSGIYLISIQVAGKSWAEKLIVVGQK